MSDTMGVDIMEFRVYRLAIPTVVRIGCILFNLSQGSSITLFSNLFAMSVSIMLKVSFAKPTRATNIALWHEILSPTNQRLLQIQNEFRIWGAYHLWSVQ